MSAAEASSPRTEVDGLAVGTLVACSFVWGLNQVAIKVANTGIQPVYQTGLRSGAAPA